MTLEKQKQDKIKAILKFINEHENFLITTHINSDGDALASVLGCSMFLEKLAKGYKIILDDQMIDPKYSFLKNWSKIQSYTEDQKEEYLAKVDAALVFDAPDNKRIGIIYDLINNKIPTTKIDHHPSEFVFGPADWIDSSASSASAMLYEIIDNSSIETDQFISEALYTGIVYDTGRLSFSNTRARDFEICATLLKNGTIPHKITNNLFFNNNAAALKVIGNGLQNLEQYENGKITIIFLSYQDLNGVDQSEIEELANYSVSLRESEVGVFIREIEPGSFKLSLRSKEYVDVSKVANQFEGGGHVRASGCRYKGSYSDLVRNLVNEIKIQL